MVYETPQGSRQNYGQQTGRGAQPLGNKAAETVRNARDYVRNRTSNISHQVQDTASKARDTFNDTMDDYPLAVGAGFMLLGLAVGLAVPTTQPERRYIGQAGRRIMDQAQQVGSQIIDKGEEIAERAVDKVRSTIKTAGERTSEAAGRQSGYESGSRFTENE